jgi:DNA-binding GntR family transcriptional regulator
MTELALVRPNLSGPVADRLREMIVDSRLQAGERINEVHLAARLGVSRTPLREALIRLEAEGALASLPRSGFFVRPLTLAEFEQIYPMRALLDPEALRLAGLPSAKRLERLETLNARLVEKHDAVEVIERDDAWHLELIADCPNGILVDLIGQFMRRTRRYELALMREQRNAQRSAADHGQILAALKARDLRRACAALRRNMQSGSEPITAWLREREAKGRGAGR